MYMQRYTSIFVTILCLKLTHAFGNLTTKHVIGPGQDPDLEQERQDILATLQERRRETSAGAMKSGEEDDKTGWPLVGNERINLYIGILGIHSLIPY